MRAVISNTFRQKLEHRLVHKDGMTRHEAKKAVEDMLTFLTEANSGGKSTPGPSADAAWHAAILHTPEYVIFCERNFGHFMHHVPTWPPRQDAHTCDQCNGNPACNSVTAKSAATVATCDHHCSCQTGGDKAKGLAQRADCTADPCSCTGGNCGLKVIATQTQDAQAR